ncbi:hypothetical protein Dsin_027727 [Dipteronia sinensis]|uniref:Bulb-type lectin domain-containing protein n=1 Tax=Dipteronia sinensis TaxID=43782 RepID=A0AAD9ZQX9_9ROSI|nr:hypothetical protein Dsin_027727 [Dipteronia sinensis]
MAVPSNWDFFSPNKNSSNRYIGIWYNDNSETIIWVGNSNKPLNDPFGVVTISEDGMAVVLNGQNEVHWSSNVSNLVTSNAGCFDEGPGPAASRNLYR